MAITGILGTASLAATTNTTVYTVPAGSSASFSVNITNVGAVGVTIQLAICTSGTPAASEYILYNYPLPAGASIERTGLTAQATKNIVAYSSSANTSVQVYGYEA